METTDAEPRPKPRRYTTTYIRQQLALERKRRKKLSRAQFLREVSMGRGDGYCFTCGEAFMWEHVRPAAVAGSHGAVHASHDTRKLLPVEIIGPAPGAKKACERLEREGRRLMKQGKTADERRKGENMVLKAEHERAMAELCGLTVPPRELPVLKKVTAQQASGLSVTTE